MNWLLVYGIVFFVAGVAMATSPDELPSLAFRVHYGITQMAFGIGAGICLGTILVRHGVLT